MFSKKRNKLSPCGHLGAVVLFSQFLLFSGHAMPVYGQDVGEEQLSGEGQTLLGQNSRQNSPNNAPTTTSYKDFLQNLGIEEEQGVPKDILRENFEVTLRFINRPIAETLDITLRKGEKKLFKDDFLVSVKSCIKEHQDIPGNDAAFIVIRAPQGELLFKGWILKLFPGASVFEHPRYDVLMRDCTELSN